MPPATDAANPSPHLPPAPKLYTTRNAALGAARFSLFRQGISHPAEGTHFRINSQVSPDDSLERFSFASLLLDPPFKTPSQNHSPTPIDPLTTSSEPSTIPPIATITPSLNSTEGSLPMTANAPTETVITMKDGRNVSFPSRRVLIKTVYDNDTGLYVRLDFVNGVTRTFKLPENLIAQFAMHGASTKLGDEIAGTETTDEAVEVVDSLIERLNSGEWGRKRGAARDAIGASILALAIAEYRGISLERVREFLKEKSHKEKLVLRGIKGIAEIVNRLEAEKAARKNTTAIDATTLLDELED